MDHDPSSINESWIKIHDPWSIMHDALSFMYNVIYVTKLHVCSTMYYESMIIEIWCFQFYLNDSLSDVAKDHLTRCALTSRARVNSPQEVRADGAREWDI